MAERQESMRTELAEVSVANDVVTITGAGESSVSLESEHTGASSTQPISGDLTLDADAGRDAPDSSAFAGVMGNLFGDTLTKTGTYLAGVIGKFSINGTRATHWVAAALAGIIAAGSEHAQAAVVAVLDGDEAAAKADAAFGVDCLNSNAGSAFGYGLDLQKEAHDGFLAVSYTNADIRLANGAVIRSSADAISDGDTTDLPASSLVVTSHNTGKGTLFISDGTHLQAIALV